MSPYQAFEVAKIGICDLQETFKNRDLKPPTPMCRSQNSTPKQNKNLKKMSSYEEDIVVWKSLMFQKALDFASDVQFGWK